MSLRIALRYTSESGKSVQVTWVPETQSVAPIFELIIMTNLYLSHTLCCIQDIFSIINTTRRYLHGQDIKLFLIVEKLC